MLNRIFGSAVVALLSACAPNVTAGPVAAPTDSSPLPPLPASSAQAPPAASASPDHCKVKDMFSGVTVSAEEFERRKGAHASKFSEVPTTKATPLEACGVRESVEAIFRLSCNDGSRPFASPNQAHASRAGNVGVGGRCETVIDLYKIPCPEQTYDLYVDIYLCPVGRGPFDHMR